VTAFVLAATKITSPAAIEEDTLDKLPSKSLSAKASDQLAPAPPVVLSPSTYQIRPVSSGKLAGTKSSGYH